MDKIDMSDDAEAIACCSGVDVDEGIGDACGVDESGLLERTDVQLCQPPDPLAPGSKETPIARATSNRDFPSENVVLTAP
jgi:hypothetical protein